MIHLLGEVSRKWIQWIQWKSFHTLMEYLFTTIGERTFNMNVRILYAMLIIYAIL
jgi:hypothetical protein